MSNRTQTFSRWLDRYQRLTGTETMDTTNTAIATQFFAMGMRRGWEKYFWPWADVTEVRTITSGSIAYDQAAKNRIAEVWAVYSDDPNGSAGYYSLTWTLDESGIRFSGDNIPATAYVYYRRDCPDYRGDAYSGATAYAIGDQVYYATTGDFYVAIASTTGNLPTDATKWTRLTIPWDLFEYAAFYAAGSLLTSNGQNDPRATALLGQAEDELLSQIEKYSRQQSFRPQRQVFFTHGTQQLRNQ